MNDLFKPSKNEVGFEAELYDTLFSLRRHYPDQV